MSGRDDGLILFLKEGDDQPPHWLRVVGGDVAAQGEGSGWLHAMGQPALPADCTVMLVPPAARTALHWIDHPDMPVLQGRAAARIAALDDSLALSDNLFAAADRNDDPDRAHVVAVTAREDMAGWLLQAQHHGLDPDIVLPAPLLIDAPEEGAVAGVLPGGERILRGGALGLVDEPDLRSAMIADAPVAMLDEDAALAGAIRALDLPPLNLRQGDFAKRRGPVIDRALVRRAAILIGFILLASLLMSLVTIVKYHAATARLDEETLDLARKQVPAAESAAQAQAMLNARLLSRGEPSASFTGRFAALMTSLQGVPDASVTRLSRAPDGTISLTLSTPSVEALNSLLIAVQQGGFTIGTPVTRNEGGRISADIQVMPQ